MVGAGVHGDRAGAEARTSRFMTCLQPCETTRIKMAKPMICVRVSTFAARWPEQPPSKRCDHRCQVRFWKNVKA